MSQENVEIVRRSFDAFLRGDFDGAMQGFHPDIAFDSTHTTPDGEVYVGHEGFRTGLRRWLGAWDNYALEVDEYDDAGASVVTFFRESGRGKASGMRIEQSVACVWTLRDGKVVRVTPFLDRGEALAAGGLREQAMSQENIEIALRAIDAWNRQDLEAFVDVWHQDAEWRPAFPEGTEGAGSVFRGHESIERAWHNVREAWAEYRVVSNDARMVGESLLVLGRIYARGATSGIEIDSDWSAVLRFKDGKIISAWDWLDHEHALEAVGLRE